MMQARTDRDGFSSCGVATLYPAVTMTSRCKELTNTDAMQSRLLIRFDASSKHRIKEIDQPRLG